MKVDMKVVDDKLKIIDEVPSSAVEMSVKEKVECCVAFFLFLRSGNESEQPIGNS